MQHLPATPDATHLGSIEAFVDRLYDLLHERAQSLGAIDIGLEVNGWHVDGEVLFGQGPDMGLSIDVQLGECRYCELVGASSERWLDDVRGDLLILDAEHAADVLQAASLEVLDGLLAARRTLLRAD